MKKGKYIVLVVLVCLVLAPMSAAAEELPWEVPAAAYIVCSPDSGEILFEKELNTKLPMASTTKIMTCILALEALNTDTVVTIDPEWVKVEGSSLGLVGGESLTVLDLLTGMMIKSGNDAANCVAYLVSGSIPAFCDLMNAKAISLGMDSTHFSSPSGLPADDHYSTVADMANLAIYAMKNNTFAQIVGTEKASIRVGEETWTLQSTNHLFEYIQGVQGIKTGYTDKAGKCLVSQVTQDGYSFVCITFNTGDVFNTHAEIYRYLFKNVAPKMTLFVPKSTIAVIGRGTIGLVPSKQVYFYRTDQVISAYAPLFVYAPVQKGQAVASYVLGKNCLFETKVELVAQGSAKDFERESFFHWLIRMIKSWL